MRCLTAFPVSFSQAGALVPSHRWRSSVSSSEQKLVWSCLCTDMGRLERPWSLGRLVWLHVNVCTPALKPFLRSPNLRACGFAHLRICLCKSWFGTYAYMRHAAFALRVKQFGLSQGRPWTRFGRNYHVQTEVISGKSCDRAEEMEREAPALAGPKLGFRNMRNPPMTILLLSNGFLMVETVESCVLVVNSQGYAMLAKGIAFVYSCYSCYSCLSCQWLGNSTALRCYHRHWKVLPRGIFWHLLTTMHLGQAEYSLVN